MALNLRKTFAGAALALGLTALAGCSSDSHNALTEVREIALARVTLSKAEVKAAQDLINAAVVADPESLRNFEAPILLVTIDKLNSVGVIGLLTDKGSESVWFSADNKSLAFRDGVVVASKGMVQDLQSADEPDIRRTLGEAVRDHYYRGGDEVIRRHRYYCQIEDRGPANANVLGRIYPTRLVSENCQSEGQSFTNTYYIGKTGEIRLSRQWLSPEVGYMQVQKVQD